jgi:hypothetical protein
VSFSLPPILQLEARKWFMRDCAIAPDPVNADWMTEVLNKPLTRRLHF